MNLQFFDLSLMKLFLVRLLLSLPFSLSILTISRFNAHAAVVPQSLAPSLNQSPDSSPTQPADQPTDPSSLPQPNPLPMQQLAPAIVIIETANTIGTGSIVSSDGLILTSAALVRNGQAITVTLATGDQVSGEVVGYANAPTDLAAVQIKGESLPKLELSQSDSVTVGQPVFAIGPAFGAGGVAEGMIQSLGRSPAGSDQSIERDSDQGLILTNISAQSGSSGSPLLNAQGEIVGINFGQFTAESGSSLTNGSVAVGIEQIMTFLADLQAGRAALTPPALVIPNARPVAIGAEIEDRLTERSNLLPSDSSYFMAYRFEGKAGQQVTIEMISDEFDTSLVLLAPDGQDLGQDDNSAGGTNAKLTATLPSDGTYTILANSAQPQKTGAYRLKLTNTLP